MKEDEIREAVLRFLLETAPVDVEAALLDLKHPDEVHDRLESLAVWAVTLAYFMNHRLGLHGAGARSHEEAVKLAMKRRTAVRKAMRYSYPEAGQFTF